MAATGSVAAVTGNPSATVNVSAKDLTADNLTMTATADSTPNISVKGYSVGAIAVGTNAIAAARDVKAGASLNADNATLTNLNINAQTVSTPNLNVNGDGGGLAGIALAAAVLDDDLTQAATVKLGGTLNVKNSVNVNAVNSDAGAYKADALGATVVGASGVKVNRNAESKAAINVDGANITSEGSQTYNATNDLGYSLDLEAAGYGGLNASAGDLVNKTKYAATVNVNNSELTATGKASSLNMNAQTTGKVSSLNNLKAAGAVEVVVSSSDIDTTFDNQINVNRSTLTTEGNASETANNFVNVDGTINAGIHSSLKMKISGGNLSANAKPTVTVTEGADIFDPSTINFKATATMENPFLADYNEALSDLQAYAPGTAEYNSLLNQVIGMEKVMATYGFAEKISGSDRYTVRDKMQVPAMEMPNIELAGGKVYVNDVAATESGDLKVNTQESYMPAVTVNNTGNGLKAPDIILNGGKKITNSAGSVTLNNANGSVGLNGEIYSLTATKVSTPNGGTIINNTGGLQNVGEDPLYKYTFGSQKFSDWLQELVARYAYGSSDKFTYYKYEDYLGSVYLMTMQYDKYKDSEKRQILSDIAGDSSWYSGVRTDIFGKDKQAWTELMLAKYDAAPTTPKSAIVSSGAVSIVAKTLNVNGLIQSGFNNYVGEVDRNSKYGGFFAYKTRVDDDAVIGDKRYRINNTDAETVYNE